MYEGDTETIGTIVAADTTQCLNGNCLYSELDEMIEDQTSSPKLSSFSRVCHDEIPLELH
jgi:hypothetical protein